MHHTLSCVLTLFWLFWTTYVEAVDTVNIFAVDFPIVAYIVGSRDAITTYAVACTAGSDTKTCNFVQPYTLIEGPKTLKFQFTAPQGTTSQSLTLACSLSGTTSMGCVATGLSNDVPATAPITTTQAFNYTGKTAEAFFSAVPVVTNSAALMTFTPGAISSSTRVGTTRPSNEVATSASAKVTSAAATASSTGKAAAAAASASTTAGSLLDVTKKNAASMTGFEMGGSGVLGICLMVLMVLTAGVF